MWAVHWNTLPGHRSILVLCEGYSETKISTGSVLASQRILKDKTDFYFTNNNFFWDSEKVLCELLNIWLVKSAKHTMSEVWQSLKNKESPSQTNWRKSVIRKESVENKIQLKRSKHPTFWHAHVFKKMWDHLNKDLSPFTTKSKPQALLLFGRSQREYDLILPTSPVWKLMFLDKTHSGNCEE